MNDNNNRTLEERRIENKIINVNLVQYLKKVGVKVERKVHKT